MSRRERILRMIEQLDEKGQELLEIYLNAPLGLEAA